MQLTGRSSAARICGAVAALTAASVAMASGSMPVAQQNKLIAEYCAVCHTDAHPNGGLTLEHFDAAHAHPGVAAMVLSKLKTGAMGAAGLPIPDKATQEAWVAATAAEAIGAHEWIVERSQLPASQAPAVIASIVQEVPSSDPRAAVPDYYRLTLTCRTESRQGEVQLAWSPATPPNGQVLSAAADGKPLLTYKVEGTEKMGNGTNGTSGPGSAVLGVKELPAQTLTIDHLFPGETVAFPFDKLTPAARQALSACFRESD